MLPRGSTAKRRELSAARPHEAAVVSYREAAVACKGEVDRIVRDCQRRNERHIDAAFNIEYDLMLWCFQKEYVEDCLVPLGKKKDILPRTRSVKRVEQIFENPQFFVEGLDAKDVRQAGIGNCWFMAAVCALGSRQDLLHKTCVARDKKIGVYGFVFHRDGARIHEVIDDKLYLAHEDYKMSHDFTRAPWKRFDVRDPDEKYRQIMQTGSDALYFAKCRNPNATWLTLLQKAYAKVHGDYGSFRGGQVGRRREGIEDLTCGVTTEIIPTDILDKDWSWTHELMNTGKLYLFGLSQSLGKNNGDKGIHKDHTYPILEARELDDTRLLKVKNPWGKDEWTRPWGDGSEEWTPERLKRLGHTFGNDGVSWNADNRFLYGVYEHRLQFKLLKFGHDGPIVESKPYYYLRRSRGKVKSTPSVPKDRDEIKILVKRDGSISEHTEHVGSGNTKGATISHQGNGVNYRVSLEKLNVPGEASTGDKTGNDNQASVAKGEKDQGDLTSKDELSPTTIIGESTTLQKYPKRTLDDISDDELSWASDVNAPLDSSSSDSSDSDDVIVCNGDPNTNKNESDEKESFDPWNAVCTIGLMIFTQGPPAEIEIVNGEKEEAENGGSGEDGWEKV
ncbi:MAG: hypothetical protein Q9203_007493 [Teloschistes exilis]